MMYVAWHTASLTDCNLANFGNSVAGPDRIFWVPGADLVIRNTLINGVGRGRLYSGDAPAESLQTKLCTLVENNVHGTHESGALYAEWRDTILLNNGDDSEWLGRFTHCCLDINVAEEQSCIRKDPLFASGPLGDHYLSQTAAGQNEDSPCVDAGSDTAEALGMDRYTTRTDGVPDTGQVDIGYHYPAFPGAEIELEKDEFTLDETMYVYGSAWNYALPAVVDVYVGLVCPDGAIWTPGTEGWELGISPWFTEIEMDTGFVYPLQWLFKLPLPSAAPQIDVPGDYLFAIALPRAGEIPTGGDIVLTPFRILD